MANRADVTVDFELSPRLVEIAVGSSSINVQDAHDTLTNAQGTPEGMQHPDLISTAGGEALGGGTTVGLTTTLLDLQIAFEGTPPRTDGNTTAASTTILEDSGKDFNALSVQRGDWVFNLTDESVTEIIEVVSSTQLRTRGLRHGTTNTFGLNDRYKIWEVSEGQLEGGNFVALDDVGADINPMFPTFGRFISKASSSSSTTQNLSTIERNAFEGGVWLDTTNFSGRAQAGTAYPNGTPGVPVSNLADALAIATEYGFGTLKLYGDLELLPGDNISSFRIIGESIENLVHINGGSATNIRYETVTLQGTLAGETQAHDCVIRTITEASGELDSCGFESATITLQAAGSLHIVNNPHSRVIGPGTALFDLNGSGELGIRGFDGGITLSNKTSGNLSIDMNSGHVIILNTCTGGAASVRGQSKFTNQGAGISVDTSGLSAEDTKTIRYAMESLRKTHQAYGDVFYVTPGTGNDTQIGTSLSSSLNTVTEALNRCSDGNNDLILIVNPDATAVTHNETIVVNKNNVHIRATSRDIIFKPAVTGDTIFTINGNSCSFSGALVDGDRSGPITAPYCIQLNGRFTLLDSLWLKQATLDCLRINAGDYHVINNPEFEKADRHGISMFDAGDPTNGSPREITVLGRSNIYLNGGDGVHVGVSAVPVFGSTTRLIRILEGDLSRNSGYGIHAEAEVDGLVIGNNVLMYSNSLGNRNILTTVYEDASTQLKDTWQVLGLDKDNPMTVTTTNRTVGDITQTISGDGTTTSTVTRN